MTFLTTQKRQQRSSIRHPFSHNFNPQPMEGRTRAFYHILTTTAMNRLFLSVLLLALCSVQLSAAFSVGTSSTTLQRRTSSSLNLSDEANNNSEAAASSSTAEEEKAPPKPAVKCPDCDLCDGSGRIEGGIGVVLKWWPIKAYRPCPNFVDRGGFYQRSGQGLDEIAFGRDSTFDPNSN